VSDEPSALQLRPFAGSDIERLVSWITDEALMIQWGGHPFAWPLTIEQIHAHLERALAATPPTSHLFTPTFEGEAVGYGELRDIDLGQRSAVVSRVLIAQPWQGRGLGSLLVDALARVTFEELQLHRLELQVFHFNQPAIRTYESLGFVHEGTLREARVIDGVRQDLFVMGLLHPEWLSAQNAS
jgi:RimJ/RimL family protein N-acetyltransferase